MKTLITLLAAVTVTQAMNITFSKSFDIEIKPDTLQANLNITVKKATEKEVIEKLSKYSTFIDNAKDIEKSGGNYNIRPEYLYENNKRYKSDYIGNMHYQIKSKKSDNLNSFITTIYNLKSDQRVDISISSVSWMMSKTQQAGKLDNLRLDAIKWGNNYAHTLSTQLEKSCNVTKVLFNSSGHYYPTPIMRNEMMMDKAGAAPVPTQDKQKISINPSFELECK
ncbi:MAG: SIMPL domain-containing protein [Epsilonproteobacteria bacterium]|nr:SIMPL domain-containing protein [Campylobacterota bacterium]